MRQDRWEQDGQSRMKVIISANSVQLLGSNAAGGQQGNSSQGSQRESQGHDASRPQGQAPQAPAPDDFSDDIPF
jgi:single-strand DNA-binding protein